MDSFTLNIYFLFLLNKFSFLLLFNYFCLLIVKVIKHYTCRALREKVNLILKSEVMATATTTATTKHQSTLKNELITVPQP